MSAARVAELQGILAMMSNEIRQQLDKEEALERANAEPSPQGLSEQAQRDGGSPAMRHRRATGCPLYRHVQPRVACWGDRRRVNGCRSASLPHARRTRPATTDLTVFAVERSLRSATPSSAHSVPGPGAHSDRLLSRSVCQPHRSEFAPAGKPRTPCLASVMSFRERFPDHGLSLDYGPSQ